MEEKIEMMEVRFGYTDEFGQNVDCKKTYEIETFEGITLPFLVDEFKLFLLGAGFASEQVAKIQFNEE